MKMISYMILALTSLSALAFIHGPHTLELDLSTSEYQQLLKKFRMGEGRKASQKMEPQTKEAIDGGEKLHKWLEKINAKRASEGKEAVRLTSKGTRRGIPIDAPSIYGPKQILERLENIKKDVPSAITSVVYGKSPITDVLPVEKEKFIEWARLVNRLYQTGVRWTTAVKPWLDFYKQRQIRDVRGYYYLKNKADLDDILLGWDSLRDTDKDEIRSALLGICRNSSTSATRCKGELSGSKFNALVFKNKYMKYGKAMWDSFFKITHPRNDVTWTQKSPDKMVAPFVRPDNERIGNWLKVHVEDEFKWDGWEFEMEYTPYRFGTAYLTFKPGVTPHVKNGNVIVMDQNASIDEYSVQWTIRHEYGHILRLPDCYVEFYDEEIQSVVNYQLDVTDLMCSRAGDMNERIYKELKRVYFKR